MRPTEKLHEQGQSLWLDNITQELLTSGTLRRYIDDYSITGLTSNPTIFHNAVKDSTAYDNAIGKLVEQGKSGEDLFFELAIEALTEAADLFRPIFERTCGVDGWVSLEVSPGCDRHPAVVVSSGMATSFFNLSMDDNYTSS